MKTFVQIREAMKKGMPPGKHVFDKKVGKIEVMVHKEKKGFTTYVNGDKLDTYKNQKAAEKAGLEFAKQFKG